MTSTSFHSPNSCRHELYHTNQDAKTIALRSDNTAQEFMDPPEEHALQTKRMKTFAGQRKFQAPVADDFSRGMLATVQVASDDTLPHKHKRLISSLTSWWRR